jgi:hypothetical protein
MAGLKSECMADIASEQLADFVVIRSLGKGRPPHPQWPRGEEVSRSEGLNAQQPSQE